MTTTTPVANTVTLAGAPDEVEPRVREALAAEGFGVLAEIDVQATLQAKLGEDIGAYTILGACNPPLARRAIAADPTVGVLLPCNVVLRAVEGGTEVMAVNAQAMLGVLGDDPVLVEVANAAAARLARVLEALAG